MYVWLGKWAFRLRDAFSILYSVYSFANKISIWCFWVFAHGLRNMNKPNAYDKKANGKHPLWLFTPNMKLAIDRILSDERISSESDKSAKLCELITVFVCAWHQTTITPIWQISIHPSASSSKSSGSSSIDGSSSHRTHILPDRDESIHRRFDHFRVLVLSIYRIQSEHFVSCNIIYIHTAAFIDIHPFALRCDITKRLASQ